MQLRGFRFTTTDLVDAMARSALAALIQD